VAFVDALGGNQKDEKEVLFVGRVHES